MDDAAKAIAVPEGYKIELFASEREFPFLANPVQLSFDNRGRLWVSTMPSYPHYRPGDPKPDDKLLILEDTNSDGKADKQTVFADGLHLPEYQALNPSIGVHLWQQQPGKYLTAAAHSLRALQACSKIGVDAALVSPVFPTASHLAQPALGNLRFTKLCRQSTLPIYALGGIKASNAARLLKSNTIGIAAISGISDNRNT